MMIDNLNINKMTMNVLWDLKDVGAKPLIVGGYVRDFVMGLEPKDIDIEVFNISKQGLLNILQAWGEVNAVGESFGIFKLDMRKSGGDELDFSLPRTENKVGQGHKGFVVENETPLTPEEASLRRDFTMNSMFMDPFTGEIFDPNNGLNHIKGQLLIATSLHYKEDALRVLRGVQFCARFDMRFNWGTKALSEMMLDEFDSLATERIRIEFEKMFIKGVKPSRGMEALFATTWLKKFPELVDLILCPQEQEWHPEGSVWCHTLEVMDYAVIIADREHLDDHKRLILLLACLCHDLGKPSTTEVINGRICSHGHCEAGLPLTESLLKRMGFGQAIIDEVKPLVKWHLIHSNKDIKNKTLRKLSINIQPSNIEMLGWLIEADHSGRGTLPKGMPESMNKILKRTAKLGVLDSALKPILQGRHLIEMGVKPSKQMGEILKTVFNAQVNGKFNTLEEAIEFTKKNVIGDNNG